MKYISRHIEEQILKLSQSYSAILLTGPRQAGKTTMLRSLAQKENIGREYVTLDVVMADSTIDIKVDLNFRLNIVKESSINLIESVTESEKKDRESFSIIVYYARVGDTLWKIAKKFGSTVDEIVKVNGIENPDVIMPGEQLFIPR